MIKVMIVEDEPPILRDIKYSVEKVNSRFTVIAEAYDGEEALEKIMEVQPDVIITDVKMPIMDGLELIEEVRSLYPSIITVILTGHHEFEFVRSAMRMGVMDYLLKPISIPYLGELLGNIERKIDLRNDEYERQHLITLINSGKIDQRSLDINYARFISVCLCVGPYSIFSIDKLDSISTGFVVSNFLNRVNEIIDVNEKVYSFEGIIGNEIIMILGVNDCDLGRISHLKRLIFEMATELSPHPVTMIGSESSDSVRVVAGNVRKSIKKLSQCVTIGQSEYFEYDKIIEDNQIPDISINLEKKIIYYLQRKLKEDFFREINDYLEVLIDLKCPQLILGKRLKKILDISIKHLQNSIDYKSIILEREVDEVLSNALSVTELKANIIQVFEVFFMGNYIDEKKQDSNNLVEEIERYLQDHFSEPITHQILSDKFGLVPYYLSKIFKRSKGVSPSKYLVNLRIQKAKELIMNSPEILSKDVAELVGYDDYSYFGKVFKMVTGMTVSEFKNSVGS